MAVSIFLANLTSLTSAFAVDFVEELTNKPLVMFSGIVSKEERTNSLVLFKGKKSGMHFFGLKGEKSISYQIQDDVLEFGGNIAKLTKECEGNDCTLYLRNYYTGEIVFSLIKPPPPGYKTLIKARIEEEESGPNDKKVVKLMKKALEEALDHKSERGADIVIYKTSCYFLETGLFSEARKGFASINEEPLAAAATIQLIVNGVEVENIDIEKIAEKSLVPLYEGVYANSLANLLAGLEAAAYACAKEGRYGLAQKYQKKALEEAKKRGEGLFGKKELRESKVDFDQLNKVAFLYSMQQRPSSFRVSVTK